MKNRRENESNGCVSRQLWVVAAAIVAVTVFGRNGFAGTEYWSSSSPGSPQTPVLVSKTPDPPNLVQANGPNNCTASYAGQTETYSVSPVYCVKNCNNCISQENGTYLPPLHPLYAQGHSWGACDCQLNQPYAYANNGAPFIGSQVVEHGNYCITLTASMVMNIQANGTGTLNLLGAGGVKGYLAQILNSGVNATLSVQANPNYTVQVGATIPISFTHITPINWPPQNNTITCVRDTGP